MAAPSTAGRRPLFLGLVPVALLLLGVLVWRFVPVNAETPEPVANYWEGEYFPFYSPRGMDPRLGTTPQTRPTLVRNDLGIDFDWGRESPGPGLPPDQFSARWTRIVRFAEGTYRFRLKSDDGVRLYVNDVLKVDRWLDNRGLEQTVDVKLSEGNHKLRVEYYENWGNASIRVGWEPIPVSSATPPAPTTPPPAVEAAPTGAPPSTHPSPNRSPLSSAPATPPGNRPPAAPPTDNLLVNGGFEQDSNDDGLPDGWTVSVPDGEFGLATGLSNTPEGKRVAALQPSMKSFTLTQDVDAGQYQGYEFSGQVNIPAAGGWFRLSLTAIPLNDQGQPLGSLELASFTSPTSGWVGVKSKITTPSYTAKIRVQAKVDVMRATAYLDNFELKAANP